MEQALLDKVFAALGLWLAFTGASQPDPRGVPTIMPQPLHPWVEACEDWDDWDKPGPAFKVHGNTYYVGTCGIAAILITSDEGHVLIDSGTEAGANVVLSNIRSLGFDPADVKLLLNSHEHFDHVGGMAILQEATGGVIVSSWIGIEVMSSGKLHEDDPQFGMHEPMTPMSVDVTPYPALPFSAPEAQYLLNSHDIWAIPTPGHSPGAMSWKWRSCEDEKCLTVVYADSLSAVSRDDYRFTDHPRYLGDFFKSLQRIADTQCNILLTPHPSAGLMRTRLLSRDLSSPYGRPCNDYMRLQRAALLTRLIKEDPEYMKTNFPNGVR